MEKRNIFAVIILNFVTLGIYHYYWLMKTRREMIPFGATNVPRVRWLLLPAIVAAIAFIALMVMLIIASASVDGSGSDTAWGVGAVVTLVVAIMAGLASFVYSLYWYYRYCQAVEQVTKSNISFAMSYGLLVLFMFFGLTVFWPAIIQDSFNKVEAGGQGGPSGPGANAGVASVEAPKMEVPAKTEAPQQRTPQEHPKPKHPPTHHVSS